ncbi:hypothetical protein Ddye_022805 [Dipteronia dyeriana]|uniref:RNase H type-1 domain-containing protein n=1 Tax=Dipteronia dyeriana TaxID=168575 RepID=A0AAD9WSQ6_9ROSI|nr:hypothetical protein Ddye_022805 [Dipteronia dyeriana]
MCGSDSYSDKPRRKLPTRYCKMHMVIFESLTSTYVEGRYTTTYPSSKRFWDPVVNRMEHRMALWKRKFLNKGGRLILIKAVLASILAYYLSIFKLPSGVARTIEKLKRSFFWGDEVVKKKYHAVSWEVLCKSKKLGGLGIGRMDDKNRSLLAKWIWRFGFKENTLWRRVICAKYGLPLATLNWDWKTASCPSSFVKADIDTGARGCLREACPRSFALSSRKEVNLAEFGKWQGSQWIWEIPLRRPCFDREKEQWRMFMSCLDAIPIRKEISDILSWTYSPDGRFIVRSFRYGLEDCSSFSTSDYNRVWQGMFSLYVGSGDSRMAEVLAIHKAISICAHSVALIGKEIDIVSDSTEAVSWVNAAGIGNLAFMNIIQEIQQCLSILGNTLIIFNFRSSNSLADSLAKNGSGKGADFVVWEL